MEYEGISRKIELFREECGVDEEELASNLAHLNVASYRTDLIRLQEEYKRDALRAVKRGRAICRVIHE